MYEYSVVKYTEKRAETCAVIGFLENRSDVDRLGVVYVVQLVFDRERRGEGLKTEQLEEFRLSVWSLW